MGKARFPDATRLLITADGAGSNGHRVKVELAKFARPGRLRAGGPGQLRAPRCTGLRKLRQGPTEVSRSCATSAGSPAWTSVGTAGTSAVRPARRRRG